MSLTITIINKENAEKFLGRRFEAYKTIFIQAQAQDKYIGTIVKVSQCGFTLQINKDFVKCMWDQLIKEM